MSSHSAVGGKVQLPCQSIIISKSIHPSIYPTVRLSVHPSSAFSDHLQMEIAPHRVLDIFASSCRPILDSLGGIFVTLISQSINYSPLRNVFDRFRSRPAGRSVGHLFLEHLIDGPKWSSFSGSISLLVLAGCVFAAAAPLYKSLINKAKFIS